MTGKSLAGGLCLHVNKNWFNTVVVREKLSTPDIELLSVSLRPYDLQREFPQLFVTLVYIHTKANTDIATETIINTVHQLQKIYYGGFNHCNPGKSLCGFEQYLTCPTMHEMSGSLFWIC